MTDDLPALVPMQCAAEFLQIDIRTLRRWIAARRIRAIKYGDARSARVVIPRDEIERFLSDHVVDVAV